MVFNSTSSHVRPVSIETIVFLNISSGSVKGKPSSIINCNQHSVGQKKVVIMFEVKKRLRHISIQLRDMYVLCDIVLLFLSYNLKEKSPGKASQTT